MHSISWFHRYWVTVAPIRGLGEPAPAAWALLWGGQRDITHYKDNHRHVRAP